MKKYKAKKEVRKKDKQYQKNKETGNIIINISSSIKIK